MKKRLADMRQRTASAARAAGMAVASATGKAADAVGTAAKASACMYLAATFGNPSGGGIAQGRKNPLSETNSQIRSR